MAKTDYKGPYEDLHGAAPDYRAKVLQQMMQQMPIWVPSQKMDTGSMGDSVDKSLEQHLQNTQPEDEDY